MKNNEANLKNSALSHGIILPNKRTVFNIWRELKELSEIYSHLPEETECFKAISKGRFTSLAYVKFVSEKTRINELYASTLRIGRKHLWVLDSLHRNGKLLNAKFIVGSVMKNDSDLGKSYKYYDDLENVCRNNGWTVEVMNNHSKILLFDTDAGKYVLETSSNLNENPNIEHFSFEKSEDLWQMYRDFFEEALYDNS